jgi:CubicO group peptidase (beta-lactamase class C family)
MKINADAAGLDAKRLENITEHFQQRYLVPEKIAGCQVAVARHGSVGYFRNFGSMDLERGKPVADDTIWRIYSMTKPITGVALMSLYEKGHFQLGDPVSRWIPEWRDLKVREVGADGKERLVDPQRPMSVKDLLMHMSGLGFGLERPEGDAGANGERPLDMLALLAAGREGMDLAGLCERFADKPLRFHPGTKWFYTVSTDICGRLVEVMSGQRFDEYLQENVFDPLGMDDTGFTVPDDKIDRFAALYRRGADKKVKLADDPERSTYRKEKTFFSGGGDLRKFALPGGYGEIGFDGMGFGLTVAVNQGQAESQSIGSAGDFSWGGAASTIFWCDPAEDLTVVFMTQLLPSGTFNFRNQLKSLVYSSIVD